MNRRRLAIVTGVPAPYRDPLFSRLAERSEVDLKVLYTAGGHDRTGWSDRSVVERSFDHIFLQNWSPARSFGVPGIGAVNPGVLGALREFRPDYVLIYGYSQLTHWLTYAYCRHAGIPFALRGDSNIWLDDQSSRQSRIRRVLLRHLVTNAAAVLPVGSANRHFWQRYGAANEQIHMAPFAVDNERIGKIAQNGQKSSSFRFVYVGRLIERKGVDLLIRGFETLATDRDVELVIVGAGPEQERLEGMQSDSARKKTRWAGQLCNESAWNELAAADVLVQPARREPWGLVINEAMAAGLPVIAGRRCGAAVDLIENGRTGWLLREPSVESLGGAMTDALRDKARTRQMGIAAQTHVQGWSFERTMEGFLAALRAPERLPEHSTSIDWRVNPLRSGRCPAS